MIALVEYVLLPAADLKGKKEFRVERRDQEPLIYTDIKQLEADYQNDVVCDALPTARVPCLHFPETSQLIQILPL